jgi:uncharacterized membrane protein HdeD (DUF308 family)
MPVNHRRRQPLGCIPAMIYLARKFLSSRRRRFSQRFDKPNQWVRLVVLGAILIYFSAVALANSVFGVRMANYWPGMASIFGGLLLSIIVIRISRPKVYLDWILAGSLHTVLGIMVTEHPLLLPTSAFAIFCVLLTSLAVVRVWIGLTAEWMSGGTWLVASGLSGLFCVAWAILSRYFFITTSPDVILTTDLLLTGLSISGFGFALRRKAQ